MKTKQLLLIILCVSITSVYAQKRNIKKDLKMYGQVQDDIVNKGDIPAVIAVLDAKVEWNEAEGNALADGNPYIDPDAVLNGVFVRLGARYESFSLKNIELHEMSNNQVLATSRYNGKVKVTGKDIDAQVAHLWTLNDGKVTAFQQYVDTKQLVEAEKE